MKRLTRVVLAGLAVAVFVGAAPADEVKLSVKGPADVTIRQGESQEVTVKVTREGFDDDVAIDFAKLPGGVKVKDEPKIPKGATEAKYTITADEDAKLVGGHGVEVNAKAKGLKVFTTFKITVKSK